MAAERHLRAVCFGTPTNVGRSITVEARITDGPEKMLERGVTVTLTFEQIDRLQEAAKSEPQPSPEARSQQMKPMLKDDPRANQEKGWLLAIQQVESIKRIAEGNAKLPEDADLLSFLGCLVVQELAINRSRV